MLCQQQGQSVDFCEHGNEPSIFIKDGKFLDQQSDCDILMKWSALFGGVGY
jgi:hypothetical protein